MPWKNTTPMEEIIRFVSLAQTGRFTITELCEQFTISRKTAYKHLERYAAGPVSNRVGWILEASSVPRRVMPYRSESPAFSFSVLRVSLLLLSTCLPRVRPILSPRSSST